MCVHLCVCAVQRSASFTARIQTSLLHQVVRITQFGRRRWFVNSHEEGNKIRDAFTTHKNIKATRFSHVKQKRVTERQISER